MKDFAIVNDNYKLLLEPEKKKSLRESEISKKNKSKKYLMKLLYGDLRRRLRMITLTPAKLMKI